MVDVTGIDRDELLEALWREAKTAGFFDVFPVPPPAWDLHRAKAELKGKTFVDYCLGRSIKTDVYTKENLIDGWLYDRDNGQGAFARVVKKLKK